MIADDYMSRI